MFLVSSLKTLKLSFDSLESMVNRSLFILCNFFFRFFFYLRGLEKGRNCSLNLELELLDINIVLYCLIQ